MNAEARRARPPRQQSREPAGRQESRIEAGHVNNANTSTGRHDQAFAIRCDERRADLDRFERSLAFEFPMVDGTNRPSWTKQQAAMIHEVGRPLRSAKTTYIIRRGISCRLALTEPLRHQPRRGRFA